MSDFTIDELCAVACAEAWRGDGEILASPIGIIPSIGARLAKATFEPDLLISDGIASLVDGIQPIVGGGKKVVESWVPYRTIFDIVWSGRRHVMMGAAQIDRNGNQNIACIGDFARPKSQLLGMRGAPGNTINHKTSYWIPNHSVRTFVDKVDVVSGVGEDRAEALGAVAEHHNLRRVVSNKAVFTFQRKRGEPRFLLLSVHPGVTVDDVVKNTGFPIAVPPEVPETRGPTAEELRLIREVIDPTGLGKKELKA
jgi:acyl CoA:acetate/3-ketoacid CoA transferase beta subunit